MKKISVFLLAFIAVIDQGWSVEYSPAANLDYVKQVASRHGCDFSNIGPASSAANMEFVLKIVDKCNSNSTTYGSSAYATKAVASTQTVKSGVKKLLNYPAYVSNGLIVSLDSNTPSSFVGNIWQDLSGNNNHFEMFNSPTLVYEGVDLSGGNKYLRTVNLLDLSPYQSVTVEVRFIQKAKRSTHIFEHSVNWNSEDGGFGAYSSQAGSAYESNVVHTNTRAGATATARNYNVVTEDFKSHTLTNIFTQVADPVGRLVYFDGLETPPNDKYPGGTNVLSSFKAHHFYMASRGGTGGGSDIIIQAVRIYGRKLTAAEACANAWADHLRFWGATPACPKP